ncbi:hypothetical protein B0H13DRAFT_1879491 [Mycena leptocephala]|nr:hypothetical protein B0H13DRAFT_1879491 [Mycena leptocephala]
MPTLYIGDLSYGKDFSSDQSLERMATAEIILSIPSIVFGVLKGVVQLNDSEQILFLGSPGIRGLDSMFAEQEASLTNMVELDRAHKPRGMHTDHTVRKRLGAGRHGYNNRLCPDHDGVVLLRIDTVGSRPTLGSKLDVQIGDLIRCTVVLQLEGRSCHSGRAMMSTTGFTD